MDDKHTFKKYLPGIYCSVKIWSIQYILLTNLVVGREVGPRVDQVASLEELGVDPEVEAQSSVGLASVAALAVPLAQQVAADADSV